MDDNQAQSLEHSAPQSEDLGTPRDSSRRTEDEASDEPLINSRPDSPMVNPNAISLRLEDDSITPSSSPPQEKETCPDGGRRKFSVIAWVFEILALILSLVSMIAAVIVLQLEDGKPLATWTFATSINTVVSTLGTVSRAALKFAVSASIGQQRWNSLKRRADRTTAFVR